MRYPSVIVSLAKKISPSYSIPTLPSDTPPITLSLKYCQYFVFSNLNGRLIPASLAKVIGVKVNNISKKI